MQSYIALQPSIGCTVGVCYHSVCYYHPVTCRYKCLSILAILNILSHTHIAIVVYYGAIQSHIALQASVGCTVGVCYHPVCYYHPVTWRYKCLSILPILNILSHTQIPIVVC